MAAATISQISVADCQTILDKEGAWFKGQYAALGTGAPSESTTLAAKALLMRTGVMGDGTTTNPGIQNSNFQKLVSASYDASAMRSRWDAFFSQNARDRMIALDNFILQNLPNRSTSDGWRFVSSDSRRPLDMFLQRVNANDPTNVPTTVAFTPTVTATTGGMIAATTAGTEPRIKVCAVGANDFYESLPSPASTQVVITGKNNAYSVASPGGNVPTGYTKLRFYRQLDANAGASDPYYWDSDLPVVAAAAYSSYLPYVLKYNDQQLRQDYTPPSYCILMLLPEEAALYLLAVSALSNRAGAQSGLVTASASGFISPYNVTLNPSNGFLGIGNPPSTAMFGEWSGGTYTQGTLQTTNSASLMLQGYGGSLSGLQARVTSALGAGYATTATYSYYDSTNQTTPVTGAVTGSQTFAATTVGTIITFSITAGRLVTAVTAISLGAGSGKIAVESVAVRSI